MASLINEAKQKCPQTKVGKLSMFYPWLLLWYPSLNCISNRRLLPRRYGRAPRTGLSW